MGLTDRSEGRSVKGGNESVWRRQDDELIALAGNPNVGKSTLFNLLTGMHQHTGNWPGKTVGSAYGHCSYGGKSYTFVDIPGTYSLISHSEEERVARDFICFGGADAVVVVCDVVCLRRNMNLALQIMEITGNVVVCVNLMDEAKKKGLVPDLKAISERLGVPVIGMSAARGEGVNDLLEELGRARPNCPLKIGYGEPAEKVTHPLRSLIESWDIPLSPYWLALRLIEADETGVKPIAESLHLDEEKKKALSSALSDARLIMLEAKISKEELEDIAASRISELADKICEGAVSEARDEAERRDRRIDRMLTNRVIGYPLMGVLLAAILWITIAGANYPSSALFTALFFVGDRFREVMTAVGAPELFTGMLIDGVYRTTAWVVSVMLPPMAIFFPLFTLLEDLGYLPRVAFNLDGLFKKCSACGKQALTMCMGLGCNAAGVIGCRIIDSPRERLIAILTNNFIPCNGRLATHILWQLFQYGT